MPNIASQLYSISLSSIALDYQLGYNSQVETLKLIRSLIMRTVNIADLKNNLSAHLERVRAGEELLVKDRNRPIARLVPLASGEDLDAGEIELGGGGVLPVATAR